MSLRLGDSAPDFAAVTTKGEIGFYEFTGSSWCVLFSHPADFTPVCTTELGEVARLQDEFDKRDVKVIALSVDSLQSHLEWIRDIEKTQNVKLNYPIIADDQLKVSKLYSFIHPHLSDRFTVRSVVIVGPDKKVKLLLTYPASCGRNMQELLRVLDSLQLTEKHKVATPVNWQKGEEVMVLPSVKTEDLPEEYRKDMKQITPYMRSIRMPDMD